MPWGSPMRGWLAAALAAAAFAAALDTPPSDDNTEAHNAGLFAARTREQHERSLNDTDTVSATPARRTAGAASRASHLSAEESAATNVPEGPNALGERRRRQIFTPPPFHMSPTLALTFPPTQPPPTAQPTFSAACEGALPDLVIGLFTSAVQPPSTANTSVAVVPGRLGGCNLYAWLREPGAAGRASLAGTVPPGTNMLAFTGPGLTDPAVVPLFAPSVAAVESLTLNLSGSEFVSLPAETFGPFGANLVAIDLSRSNWLTYVERGAFYNLTRLASLDLSNGVVGSARVVNFFGALGNRDGVPSLETLNLRAVGIESLFSGIFDGVPNLRSLDLSYNWISLAEPGVFRNMTHLNPSAVKLWGNPLLCYAAPSTGYGGGPELLCVACTPNPRNLTQFHSFSQANQTGCQVPVTFVGLPGTEQCNLPPVVAGIAEPEVYIPWNSRSMYAIGRAYNFQPLCILYAQLSDGGILRDTQGQLQFDVRPTGNNTRLPQGLYFRPSDAAIVFTPALHQQNQTVEIWASLRQYTGEVFMGNLSIATSLADVDNPNATTANGFRLCFNGGHKVEEHGASEFDGRFSCDCTGTGYVGPSCNVVQTLQFASVNQVASASFPDALRWDNRTMWAIGTAYYLQAINVSRPVLSVTLDPVNVTDITFSISPSPVGLLLDPKTGFAQFVPRTVNNFTATVFATLGAYRPDPIGTVVFDVRFADVDNPAAVGPNGLPCFNNGTKVDTVNGTSEFDGQYTCACTSGAFAGPNCRARLALYFRASTQYLPAGSQWAEVVGDSGTGTANYTRYNNSLWAIGDQYRIAPVHVIDPVLALTSHPALALQEGTSVLPSSVTFTLDPTPPGWFINQDTGEIIGQPERLGTIISNLTAFSDGVASATPVATINFTVRARDTSDPSNGPNGRDCADSEQRVDTVPFDHNFTCNCSRTPNIKSSGSNCVPVAGTSSGDQASTASVAAIVVAVVVVVVLVLAVAVSRYQLWRARHRPEDLTQMQSEIFESLGIGQALDIQPHQFGVTLMVDAVRAGVLVSAGQSEEDFRELEAGLRSQMVPILAAHKNLDVGTAVVTVAAVAEDRILVVFDKPPGARKGLASEVVSTLSKAASRGRIQLGDNTPIVDVCVAIPRRVPREINRTAVVRLSPLGEGHYAEVIKCELNESKSSPSYPVAAKILKTGMLEARDELLKEAALMALLEHSNVVSLIGIVTVPRNMPALLLLQYCEHGNLRDHVINTPPDELNTSMLLTFCADACAGLSYLSSCRIVHRDVAARNVLLDAKMTAKVSDFGMSTALAGNDDEYSKNYAAAYVEMGGDLPVRWSAIEVLQSGKFSRASDVWAFGCLVYEVITRGRLPYDDRATTMEVTAFVKGGGIMSCPNQCPQQIYDEIMRPCWSSNPQSRPGFTDLYHHLIALGAIESDEQDKPLPRGSSAGSDAAEADDRKLRGLSVHHIASVLRPAVLKAARRSPVPAAGVTNAEYPDTPEDATIAHAVQLHVKPVSASAICPWDRQPGAAYVDTMGGDRHAGRATALLSYTWSYKVASVAAALERWADKIGLDADKAYVWICAFCLNQHRMVKKLTPDELSSEFGTRVRGIGYLLPMLEPWRNPLYLTRAWCLFELYTAITNRTCVKIDVILTESENKSFLRAMATEGYGCIDSALQNIHAERATATEPSDFDAIRALVTSMPGGFPALNETVKAHLHSWFESNGAVPRARRSIAVMTSRSASRSSSSSSRGQIVELKPFKKGRKGRSGRSGSGDSDADPILGPSDMPEWLKSDESVATAPAAVSAAAAAAHENQYEGIGSFYEDDREYADASELQCETEL